MVPHPHDDGPVERGVSLSMTAAVEAVAARCHPGRSRDGAGPAELGEGGFRMNPIGVVAKDDQHLGGGVGTDAKALTQRRRGLVESPIIRKGRSGVKKRFTEAQIIGFLREAEAGLPVKDLCRRHGFSEASYYLWRSKFGGMSVSDAKRLKELETENGRIKKLLAESQLEIEVTREVLRKKW